MWNSFPQIQSATLSLFRFNELKEFLPLNFTLGANRGVVETFHGFWQRLEGDKLSTFIKTFSIFPQTVTKWNALWNAEKCSRQRLCLNLRFKSPKLFSANNNDGQKSKKDIFELICFALGTKIFCSKRQGSHSSPLLPMMFPPFCVFPEQFSWN